MTYQHLLASSTTASQIGSSVGTVVGYGIIILLMYGVYRVVSGVLGKTKIGNTSIFSLFRRNSRRGN